MKDYEIVTASTSKKLKEKVKIMMSEGWVVNGGVSMVTYKDIHKLNKYMFAQSMIKYD